jgi:hypothetical protein
MNDAVYGSQRDIPPDKAFLFVRIFTDLISEVPLSELYDGQAIVKWVPNGLKRIPDGNHCAYQPVSTDLVVGDLKGSVKSYRCSVRNVLYLFSKSVCGEGKLIRAQGFGDLVDASCAAVERGIHALESDSPRIR